MKNLKTLKELTIDLSKNLATGKSDKDFQIAKIKELKAEAVKWVKKHRIRIPIYFGHPVRMYLDTKIGRLREDIVENRDINITFEVREIFKHFFNLTKEDLK